jgi:type IV pilus assembly protein PilQ
VPADQVVDIIFQQKALDMRKNGNVILIAPRDELATKEKLDYEARQQIGELEPLRTEAFQINYQKADALKALLSDPNQRMLSKRGSAVVDARTNTLFINDTSSRLVDARAVITRVDVPVRQVLIEARIVEASDAFSRNLGVRLGYSNPYRQGPNGAGLSVGGGFVSTAQNSAFVVRDPISGENVVRQFVQGTPDYNAMQQVNLPASPRSGIAGALSFLLYSRSLSELLNVEISALEADGRGKVISSPRVMTADQIEALIEQGVEIPYQQATSSGATSISFRKANLSLKVKPQITPDGKITLSLVVNKDTPNATLNTGSGVAIDTKHVKTEVLVDNGGTVVIGGIYTQNSKNNTTKIPLLGDIPFLGWLFKNNEIIDDKTELLIFITPKIVNEKLGMN